MIFLRVILIIIISIFDIFILFIYDTNILIILLIHLLLYLAIRYLSKDFTDACAGIPIYLVLFMPGLGGLIVSALFVNLHFFKWNSLVLADYERYLDFEHSLDKQKKINYIKEIGTFSFIDQMRLLNVKEKKDLIVEYSLDYKNNKINAVQRGLQDGDSEVRHYSAVTINMLESEYLNGLNELREEYNIYQDTNSLMKLYNGYKVYLSSGLISKEVYQIINKEYIEILLKVIDKNIISLEVLDDLVKAYLSSENIINAKKINDILLSKYPNKSEGYINKIKIAYEKRDYEELTRTVNEVELSDFENKEDIKDHLLFWSV